LQESVRALQEKIESVEKIRRSYDEAIETLEFLPTKVQHEAILSIAGSKLAFFRGNIINTNTVLMQLSSEYYIKRTTDSAVKSLMKRRQTSVNLLKSFQDQLQDLKVTSQVLKDEPQFQQYQAASSVPKRTKIDIDLTKSTNAAAPSVAERVLGSIRKTPEGFIEIIERIEDDTIIDEPGISKSIDDSNCPQSAPPSVSSEPIKPQRTIRKSDGFLQIVERDPDINFEEQQVEAPRQSLFSRMQAEKKQS